MGSPILALAFLGTVERNTLRTGVFGGGLAENTLPILKCFACLEKRIVLIKSKDGGQNLYY